MGEERWPRSNKARLLFLLQYLFDQTDDEHPVTREKLMALCQAQGFNVSRNTLHDDLETLEKCGFGLICGHQGTQNLYFCGNRPFELGELRMLVDAVSSSRFIAAERSDTLIQKLSRMACEPTRPLLAAKVHTTGRRKSEVQWVTLNTDLICRAIDAGRQLTFQYFDYDVFKRRVHRHGGERYSLSPYALIWSDDRYYAVGYTRKHNGVTTFRVDRMDDVTITDEALVQDPGFDPVAYAQTRVKMYTGDFGERELTLLCDSSLMHNIIDRFGEEADTQPVDEQHFLARARVAPGPTFYGWLLQYGGGIRLTGPQDVREDYERYLRQTLARQLGEEGAQDKNPGTQ